MPFGAPFGAFNGIPFDWAQGQPQKERKNGADYYTGGLIVYYQTDLDALWTLRAVVNVRPVGDGGIRVYIDSWADPATIRHTLSMSNAREQHVAILTELALEQRHWDGTITGALTDPSDRLPIIVAFNVRAEFLLLS